MFHHIGVEHVVCTAHGVVEHTGHTEHAEAAPPTSPGDTVRATPSAEHDEECSLVSVAQARRATVPLGAEVPGQTAAVHAGTICSQTPSCAGDVLARAPKTSPPALVG